MQFIIIEINIISDNNRTNFKNNKDREGFEPTVSIKYNSFQNYRLKPLGHLPVTKLLHYKQLKRFELLTLTLARLHSTN